MQAKHIEASSSVQHLNQKKKLSGIVLQQQLMKNSKKSLVAAADRYDSVNDGGKEPPLQTLFTSGDDV